MLLKENGEKPWGGGGGGLYPPIPLYARGLMKIHVMAVRKSWIPCMQDLRTAIETTRHSLTYRLAYVILPRCFYTQPQQNHS